MRRMPNLFSLSSALLVFALAGHANADIFRWDNGQAIPGTQGIVAGPNISLKSKSLQFAELSNADLTNVQFDLANLTSARLSGATIAGATFYSTTSKGLTSDQIYSTASYQSGQLQGVSFSTTPNRARRNQD